MALSPCPNWLLFLVSFLCMCTFFPSFANSLSSLQKPSCLDHERSALLQFKDSFTLNCATSDAYPKMKSWGGDTNCCQWDGVRCINNETGHVVVLSLSNSCLYGNFPSNSSIFSLTHLLQLDLSSNDFIYSQIPSELGKLSDLRALDLSDSKFIGQIPSEILRLSKLIYLNLVENDGLELHHPSLESLVLNLTLIRYLALQSVDISSSVPQTLANLTSLEYLNLELCNVYGQFPRGIFNLPNLQYLHLIGNINLLGSLPEFRPNSPLTKLSLSNTRFYGQVPPSIGQLAHLKSLVLQYCDISGTIPSSLGNLTNLFELNLEGSLLSGDIPSSLTNLTQLQIITLSHLYMRPGNLYSWLSKLNKLAWLDLLGMNLAGEIPSFLANLTSLNSLDLKHNKFTGPIPHWLMNLTRLEKLSLSDNELHGLIPDELSQLANLNVLYLNDNNIYGKFEAFLPLNNLQRLDLSYVKLTFPGKSEANETIFKLIELHLTSCNLTEFPQFLQSQDELQELYLDNNIIDGLIPQWFVNITRDSLYILHLSNNFIIGFEQPTMILPWRNLVMLYLQDNKIQGLLPIPSTSLSVYQVSENSFAGSIPHAICHASSLIYFDVSFNKIDGRIPECIGELGRSLIILNLQGNNLSGTIPVLPKSCRLKMINLGMNQLVGKMPRSIANCDTLEVLDVGNNHVNDTFPSWLASLKNLKILILRHNNFHGSISNPNNKPGFYSLHIIDLSHNFHNGELPSHYFQNWDAIKNAQESQSTASSTVVRFSIKMPPSYRFLDESYNYSITITNKGNDMLYTKILTVFQVIDFSSNNFTGSIPNCIGKLRGLQALNLSNNNLAGSIPSSLSNIRDLESLDLSNNMLSGVIPQELTQLTSLEVFNVSHNHLVGHIPQGRQFNTFDNSSFDRNLGLCGDPLSRKCGNADEPQHLPLTSNDKEDDSDFIDWIIKGLGCVSGLAIGCAIGKYTTDRNHEWFVETFGRRRLATKGKRPTRRNR